MSPTITPVQQSDESYIHTSPYIRQIMQSEIFYVQSIFYTYGLPFFLYFCSFLLQFLRFYINIQNESEKYMFESFRLSFHNVLSFTNYMYTKENSLQIKITAKIDCSFYLIKDFQAKLRFGHINKYKHKDKEKLKVRRPTAPKWLLSSYSNIL